MLSWLTPLALGIGIGIVGMVLWHHFFGIPALTKEKEQNDRQVATDDQQVRWHIRHIQQDIISITRILFSIFCILLFMLFLLLRDFFK